MVKDDRVLVTYPPQVSVPEFPGGSAGRREDFRGCLFRKLFEETGIEFMLDGASGNTSKMSIILPTMHVRSANFANMT